MDKEQLNKSIIGLLEDLHSFNILNNIIVDLISINFDVKAKELCKENGITYNVE